MVAWTRRLHDAAPATDDDEALCHACIVARRSDGAARPRGLVVGPTDL
jgi:hypothetical protein